MEEVEDPIALINTLQRRISQLEQQLQWEREQTEANAPMRFREALRRMRLHSVIPLFVGQKDLASLREEVAKSSPELLDAIDDVWMLSRAPLDQAAKNAITLEAEGGMSRW